MNFAASQAIDSITVLIGYRSDSVTLGETGTVVNRVKKKVNAFGFKNNNLGYAVRVLLSNIAPPVAPSTTLFTVAFDTCGGAAAPTSDDFSCTVEGCDDPNCTMDGCPAPSMTGCTCAVAIQ